MKLKSLLPLLFLNLLLLPCCFAQSLDDEKVYEGSGVENPDDEDSEPQGPKQVAVTTTTTTTTTTTPPTTVKPTVKPTEKTTPRAPKPQTPAKEPIEPKTFRPKQTIKPDDKKAVTPTPSGGVTPKSKSALSNVPRSTWLLILTAAIIACILISIAVYIFKQRSQNKRRGAGTAEYRAGVQVRNA